MRLIDDIDYRLSNEMLIDLLAKHMDERDYFQEEWVRIFINLCVEIISKNKLGLLPNNYKKLSEATKTFWHSDVSTISECKPLYILKAGQIISAVSMLDKYIEKVEKAGEQK